MKIIYSQRAKKDLKQIETKQVIKILEKIEANSMLIDPLSLAKKLQGINFDLYRYRVGDFRVIFILEKDIKIMTIFRIGHRKDIYKNLI